MLTNEPESTDLKAAEARQRERRREVTDGQLTLDQLMVAADASVLIWPLRWKALRVGDEARRQLISAFKDVHQAQEKMQIFSDLVVASFLARREAEALAKATCMTLEPIRTLDYDACIEDWRFHVHLLMNVAESWQMDIYTDSNPYSDTTLALLDRVQKVGEGQD